MSYKELVKYLDEQNIHRKLYCVSWDDRLTNQNTIYFSKRISFLITKRMELELRLLGYYVIK